MSYADSEREDLVREYANHRCNEGDWDDDEEAMTQAQRFRHFCDVGRRLTTDQLISACNSYAIAGDC